MVQRLEVGPTDPHQAGTDPHRVEVALRDELADEAFGHVELVGGLGDGEQPGLSRSRDGGHGLPRGYRPLQIWVPDVRSDAFADEAHRQSARLAAADHAGDDQHFVDAISVQLTRRGMNRGEIWTAAGGVYASKHRPVLIVQDDRFDATESVVVIPLTTHVVDAPLTQVPIMADALSGISQPSYAMVDKVTTVRRSSLGSHVGRASAAQLVEVERALLVFLGIAG